MNLAFLKSGFLEAYQKRGRETPLCFFMIKKEKAAFSLGF